MRVHKYKAWDKDAKKWLDLKHLLLDCNGKVIGYDAGDGVYTITKVELLQFTGLKDKNGVEIYEGDIVQCIGYLDPLIVTLKYGSFLFGDNYASESSRYGREVIGNIWEHPHLLKEVRDGNTNK